MQKVWKFVTKKDYYSVNVTRSDFDAVNKEMKLSENRHIQAGYEEKIKETEKLSK